MTLPALLLVGFLLAIFGYVLTYIEKNIQIYFKPKIRIEKEIIDRIKLNAWKAWCTPRSIHKQWYLELILKDLGSNLSCLNKSCQQQIAWRDTHPKQ